MRKFLILLAAIVSPALAQTPAGTINAPIYATGYISQGGGTNVTTKIPAQSNHPTNLNIYLTGAVTGTWSIQLPNPAFEGQILSFNCGSSATAVAVTSTDGSSLDSSIPTSCNGNSGFVVQFDQRDNTWRNLGSNATTLAGVTVNNNTQLTALPSTISVATRLGYATAGDAPPVLYTRSNSACSLNAGAGDGGSRVPASGGKCWIGAMPPSGWDVRQFGAKSSDDTTRAQRAIDAAKAAGGGTVWSDPAGMNIVSADLTIPLGVTLTAPQWPGVQGRTGNDFTAVPYALYVDPSRTVKVAGSLEKIFVLRKGLIAPTNARSLLNQVAAFAGTGVTITGVDGKLEDVAIGGFATCVTSSGVQRPRLYRVFGDCTNGANVDNAHDIPRWHDVQFWEFLTTNLPYTYTSYAISGAADNGSGSYRLTPPFLS